MDILETLFNGEYEPPMLPEGELDAWLEQDYAFWEHIEALAGPEETETLWFQRGELEAALRLSGFREGFRLGASLLLALHP